MPSCFEYGPLLWGESADYDSDGDAYDDEQPTYWTILDIRHRQTNERLIIKPLPNPEAPPPFYQLASGGYAFTAAPKREQVSVLMIEGDSIRSVQRAAYLTAFRSGGSIIDPETSQEVALSSVPI